MLSLRYIANCIKLNEISFANLLCEVRYWVIIQIGNTIVIFKIVFVACSTLCNFISFARVQSTTYIICLGCKQWDFIFAGFISHIFFFFDIVELINLSKNLQVTWCIWPIFRNKIRTKRPRERILATDIFSLNLYSNLHYNLRYPAQTCFNISWIETSLRDYSIVLFTCGWAEVFNSHSAN